MSNDEGIKLYECMYIIRPDIDEEQVQNAIEGLHQAVREAGGEIEADYDWGRRQFAYKIRQLTEGLYRIMYFRGDGRAVDEVKHQVQTDERLIRAMVIVASLQAIYRPEEEAVAEGEEAAEAEAAQPAEAAEPATEASGEESQESQE